MREIAPPDPMRGSKRVAPRFADRLLESRAKTGISQAALAAKIGIAPTQISRYERGGCEPRMGVVYRISGALGVTPEWLLAGEEVESPELEATALDISAIPTRTLLTELSRRHA